MSAISDKYAQLGGAGGLLGAPVSAEVQNDDREGWHQDFEWGSIYFHPNLGAYEVHGAIRERWLAMGREQSSIGYPLTDETPTPEGVGRFNHFQRGSIYWHLSTGAHDVQDRIRERWAELRWEQGFLGFPVDNYHLETRGRTALAVNRFQGGRIEHDTAVDALYVYRCPTPASPNFRVRIVAISARDADGSRPVNITVSQIQDWLNNANRVFAVAGIRFEFNGIIRALDDTDVNSLTGAGSGWATALNTLNNIAAQERAVVIVFRHGPDSFPTGGGFSWWTYDFVVMPGFPDTGVCNVQNIGLLAHELGHFFGLPHTHGPTFKTQQEAVGYLAAHGFNSGVFDGDQAIINDTPPDPFIDALQCQTIVKSVALASVPFAIARENAMGYWYLPTPQTFTHAQIERIRDVMAERAARGVLDRTVIWHPASEIQLYGWAYDAYRARYDELWKDGWRLRLLDIEVIDGEPRYWAVFRPTGGDEIQLYGWGYDAYRARYDELWKDGWRLHLLDIEVIDGEPRYWAVFRRTGEDEIQLYGWAYDAYRARYDELWKDGWRLHLLDIEVIDGEPRYWAVFRPTGEAEIQLYGWAYDAYRARYDELWRDGWRLRLLDIEVIDGEPRYWAVFRPTGEAEIQLYGWAYDAYRARYDELWRDGWRLHLLDVEVIDGEPRYWAVFHMSPTQFGTCDEAVPS